MLSRFDRESNMKSRFFFFNLDWTIHSSVGKNPENGKNPEFFSSTVLVQQSNTQWKMCTMDDDMASKYGKHFSRRHGLKL